MFSKITKYRISCAKKLHGLILDLGAGEGDYTSYLNGDVVSLDLDFTCLKSVRGLKVAGSALHLPFRNDTFDGIWSCAVLEHVEINYIPEAVRITKNGGTIYILTCNRNSPWDPIKRLFGYDDWWSDGRKVRSYSAGEGHVRLYSVGELRRFGKVTGEIWWAPGIDQIARYLPIIGHTRMLKIEVTQELKSRLRKR